MAKVLIADNSFDSSIFNGSSCAFGVFDGVHVGHRFLIGQAVETARESGGAAIALTFDIDPDELFHADRLKKLMSNEARLEMLATLPVDYVVALPFSYEFASAEPMEFLQNTFGGHAPSFLHVGCDFRFGKRAAGTVADLREWANDNGVSICAHDLKSANQLPVTATRIRLLLHGGSIAEANHLLSRRYFLDGVVQHGRGEGTGMGFSTANLHIAPLFRTLGDGVYAAWVSVDGVRYKAAVSVGLAPTFEGEAQASCEVHLLDFNGNLYGKRIRVEFDTRLRPMMKFENADQLINTVQENIAWVREHLH